MFQGCAFFTSNLWCLHEPMDVLPNTIKSENQQHGGLKLKAILCFATKIKWFWRYHQLTKKVNRVMHFPCCLGITCLGNFYIWKEIHPKSISHLTAVRFRVVFGYRVPSWCIRWEHKFFKYAIRLTGRVVLFKAHKILVRLLDISCSDLGVDGWVSGNPNILKIHTKHWTVPY